MSEYQQARDEERVRAAFRQHWQAERAARRREARCAACFSFGGAVVFAVSACGTGPDWWRFALCALGWLVLGLVQWREGRAS